MAHADLTRWPRWLSARRLATRFSGLPTRRAARPNTNAISIAIAAGTFYGNRVLTLFDRWRSMKIGLPCDFVASNSSTIGLANRASMPARHRHHHSSKRRDAYTIGGAQFGVLVGGLQCQMQKLIERTTLVVCERRSVDKSAATV